MSDTNKQNNETDKSTILELYKLHVEMADRVSQRREVTHKLFISINSAILILVGATIKYTQFREIGIIVFSSVLGIALGFIWIGLIASYKKLNRAKFKVIKDIEEKHLPIKFYTDEERVYKEDNRKDFSNIQTIIPIVFIVIYFGAMLVSIYNCL